jgi:CubicO group peptidase (beta-lactamase class C family)
MRALVLAVALTLPAHTSAVAGGSNGIVLSRDAHTVYDIGSVAKTFTAAAVLELAQQRALRLNETLGSLFSGVPRAKRSITVAELLTHTSGLPEYLGSDQVPLTRAEALRAIFALPLGRRGRFAYSDAGYTLLAAIVQRVAQEPFEQYVRRLLSRAGLHETGFFNDARLHGLPFAHGYVGGADRGVAGTQAPLSWSILGAGGLLSTAADLYRWVRALQSGGVLDVRWRETMWRAGYGWVVGRRGLIAVGGGTDFGYTSDVRLYTRSNRVTVVLSATDAHPALSLARGLRPS